MASQRSALTLLAVAVAVALAAPAAARPKKHTPKNPTPTFAPLPDPAPAPAVPPAAPAAPAPAPTPPPPSVTPAPAPPPKVDLPPPPAATTDDIDALQSEYDALRDQLFRSRARIGLLGEAVFKTKLVVDVEYQAQRDWPLKRLVVQLDDKQVFAEDRPTAAGKAAMRAYDSFAGIGRHILAVSVESAGPDARVGFGATAVFFVDVVDGKTTRVAVAADETGDGPSALARKREGRYDVRLRAEVKTEPLPVGLGAK